MGYYEKDEWGYIVGYQADPAFDCEKCKEEELYNRWWGLCGHPDCGHAYSHMMKVRDKEKK